MHWSGDSGDWWVVWAAAARRLLPVAVENADYQQPRERRSLRQHARVGPDSELVAAALKQRREKARAESPPPVVVDFRN
jgi:hypothetical protein